MGAVKTGIVEGEEKTGLPTPARSRTWSTISRQHDPAGSRFTLLPEVPLRRKNRGIVRLLGHLLHVLDVPHRVAAVDDEDRP